MSRRLTACTFAMLLVLCALGGSGSASAAAQPFHESDCLVLNAEQGLVYCYESRGVTQTRITPTGRFVGITNFRSSYTVLLNGEVIETGTINQHNLEMAEDELSHVFRASNVNTFTYSDPETGQPITCTDTVLYVFANGEVRHDAHDLRCD